MPKNETKTVEMVDVIAHMHKYVLIIESSEEVHLPSLDEKIEFHQERAFPIIIAGDKLTAARTLGAKRQRSILTHQRADLKVSYLLQLNGIPSRHYLG